MKCWQHKSAKTTRLGSQPCGAQPSSRASVGPPKIDFPQQERVQNQTSFWPVFSPFSVFRFSLLCSFFSFLSLHLFIPFHAYFDFSFLFRLLHFISISLFFFPFVAPPPDCPSLDRTAQNFALFHLAPQFSLFIFSPGVLWPRFKAWPVIFCSPKKSSIEV